MNKKQNRIFVLMVCVVLVATTASTAFAATNSGNQTNAAGLFLLLLDSQLEVSFAKADMTKGIDYTVKTGTCWGDEMGRVYLDMDNKTITINALATQTSYTIKSRDNYMVFLAYTILWLDSNDACQNGVVIYGTTDDSTSIITASELANMASSVQEMFGL